MTTTNAPPRYQPSRSGRDRRNGADRRARERRTATVAVRVERRVARDRRRAERRTVAERRRGFRRAAESGATETPAVTRLSARDRTKARMLPDEFLMATGDTTQRLGKVIRKKWANAPRQVRAGLASGLSPILDTLSSGAPVTEAVRDACEEVAATWLAPFKRR